MEKLVPVVIDLGSHTIKAGFGDERNPRFVTSTIVGKVMGPEIYNDSPKLSFAVPFERDKIKSRSAYDDLLDYTIVELLKLRNLSANSCSILITFPLNGSRDDRSKLQEILFNTYGFAAVYITSDAAMSFVASGKSTGVIVQMGHEVASVVAIIEDVPQTIANVSRDHPEYEVMNIGGVDVSKFLKPEMDKEELFKSIDLRSPQGQKEMNKYKSEHCYFAEDYFKEMEKLKTPEKSPEIPKRTSDVDKEPLPGAPYLQFVKDCPISRMYSSHTKSEIPVATASTPSLPKKQAFFEGPEVFFQPGIAQMDGFGLDKRIYNVIVKVPNIGYHGILYENIVLSGGSAKIKGIKERLSAEIINAVPRGARLNITFPHEREFIESDGGYTSEEVESETGSKANSPGIESLELAAFRGACRLTQLPHYISLLMSKKDFEETTLFVRTPFRRSVRRSIRTSRPPSMIQIFDE